jgi:hypothetical protein
METMMPIDRQTAQTLGREIEEALREIAERHSLTVELRGGTYDASTFRPRVEFKTSTADQDEFTRYANHYDLDPGDFGREFVSQGRTFRISGIAPRSPKRPILCDEVATGRMFKFTVDAVKDALS